MGHSRILVAMIVAWERTPCLVMYHDSRQIGGRGCMHSAADCTVLLYVRERVTQDLFDPFHQRRMEMVEDGTTERDFDFDFTRVQEGTVQ